MKKSHVIILMIVVALALPLALYVQAAIPTAKVKTSEVAIKAPGHKELWNQAGSGFELSSLPNAAEMTAPLQKYWWSHSGGGLTELTTVQTSIPVQKQQWNRFGSGFELSSVRTITEIKASIQKYMWSHSGGGLTELTAVRTTIPVQKYLWSHSGGGLTELTTVQTAVTASSNPEPAAYRP